MSDHLYIETSKLCLIFEKFFPGKVLYLSMLKQCTEAFAQRFSFKKVFLEILKNSHENTSVRVSFLMKLQVKANNFIKKETDTFFPVNFGNILRTSFLTEHLRWLLLDLIDSTNLLFGGCVYQECIQTWIWMIITEK